MECFYPSLAAWQLRIPVLHGPEPVLKNLRMKVARVSLDMTQGELAAKVGVSRQTISSIEKGGYNPSLRLCIDICKALGKSLDDLFWEEEA